MRNTRTCPKCSSRKLFVIGRVHQPDYESSIMSYPMVVTSKEVPTGRRKLGGPEEQRVIAGYFEAWVCAACGFTEWYARNANEDLARLAQHPETGVVFLDGEAPATPYR